MINVVVLMALPFLFGIFLMLPLRRVVGKEHFLPGSSP